MENEKKPIIKKTKEYKKEKLLLKIKKNIQLSLFLIICFICFITFFVAFMYLLLFLKLL